MTKVSGVSAVTLATADMTRAVGFYEAVGLDLAKGGPGADFTSFQAGDTALNLIAVTERTWSWWGRVIFYVSDVDGMYEHLLDAGVEPDFKPSDAPWGERYFHITDPDGHEISFAAPLT